MINIDNIIQKIDELKSLNLYDIAPIHGITIKTDSGYNKGWCGHLIEKHLGLEINSNQAPDIGEWELKYVPMKYLKNGKLVFKETMAITMINKNDIINTSFENSHLYEKIRKLILVLCIVESDNKITLYKAFPITLNEDFLIKIKNDYLVLQDIVKRDFNMLSGKYGTLVQARTKGKGKGSTSRAFYAKKSLLNEMLMLSNIS